MIEGVGGRAAAARVLLGATLLLGPACAREAEPFVRELRLEAAGPVEARRQAQIVARLSVPPQIDPWQVRAARAQAQPAPGGGAPALYLHGQGEKSVLLPGRFEPRAFDQIAVELYAKRHSWLTLSLMRAGEPVLRARPLEIWSSDDRQRLVAKLPLNALEEEPFDAIELAFDRHAGPLCIVGLELLSLPLRSWLPPAGGPPQRADLCGDSRAAMLMDERTGLVGRFEAEKGAELALSLAQPDQPRFPGQRPRLSLRLEAQGTRSFVGHELEGELSQRPIWHELRIPLDEFAGRSVEARFELHVDGPWPAFAWVSEARILRPAKDPPTVLFVSSDTHRADHVGSARDAVPVRTPALDELARRSVVFERAYSTSNITVPSHVALMTGLHPRDTLVLDNTTGIAREAATLAEGFASAGYRTFAIVSVFHLGDVLSGLGQGFERMSVPAGNERTAEEACALAERWLESAAGEPVFLWLHLFDAHAPYAAPEEIARAELGGEPPAQDAELPEDLRRQRALYRAEVCYLDRELGRVLRLPRIEHGIVAFTADHGESLGAHGIWFEHEELYPDTLHVPLILRWPGGPEGGRVQAPVQNTRIARTLLDLARLESAPIPGRSLVEELSGPSRAEPAFAIAFAGRSASITHERWHLILHLEAHRAGTRADAAPRELHAVELYDLQRDRGCEQNLVESELARATALRRALIDWLAAGRPSGLARAAQVDAEVRSRLGELGYAGEGSTGGGVWIEAECACAWCARFERR